MQRWKQAEIIHTKNKNVVDQKHNRGQKNVSDARYILKIVRFVHKCEAEEKSRISLMFLD